MRAHLAVFVVVSITLGCPVEAPEPEHVCAPGDSKHCYCAGGLEGAQVCQDDGTEWGGCDCSPTSDAGFTDAEASDAPRSDGAQPDAGQSWPDGGLCQGGAPDLQVDLFTQRTALAVDILWVVDNSESMEAEQDRIADHFRDFYKQLLSASVSFHIGVLTTDPTAGGVLRQYSGPAVSGCDGCRYLSSDVPCDNPDVSFSPGTPEAEIEAGLQVSCPALLVFRRLMKAGTDGASFEQGLANAATALGAHIDPSTGSLQLDTSGHRIIPPENLGFLRDTASLHLVFVSDEDDGSRGTARYYYRLFEGLKLAGNEGHVAISAITGWPNDSQGLTVGNICDVLRTGFDLDPVNDDPDLAAARDLLSGDRGGCFDPTDNSPNRFARVGGRVVELACRSDGVVLDICSGDYTSALSVLGARAAGLQRVFPLSWPTLLNVGFDGEAFTGDDPFVACGALTPEQHAAPICVEATPLGETGEVVVAHSIAAGYQLDQAGGGIRFDGSFVPAPGTRIAVTYGLSTPLRDCPAEAACNAALSCQAGAPCVDNSGCEAPLFCDIVGGECLDPRSSSENCSLDTHCPFLYRCSSLQCSPGCADSADCPLGFGCVMNACVQGGCTTRGDCEFGERCISDSCQRAIDGQTCQDCSCPAANPMCSNILSCIGDSSHSCLVNTVYDVSDPGTSPENYCAPDCTLDDDCPWGFSCNSIYGVVDVCSRGETCANGQACRVSSEATTGYCPCTIDGDCTNIGLPGPCDQDGLCLSGRSCGLFPGMLCADVGVTP